MRGYNRDNICMRSGMRGYTHDSLDTRSGRRGYNRESIDIAVASRAHCPKFRDTMTCITLSQHYPTLIGLMLKLKSLFALPSILPVCVESHGHK